MLERRGRALGVRRRQPAYEDYYDFIPGRHAGHREFIKVPKTIATGQNAGRNGDQLLDGRSRMLPADAQGSVCPTAHSGCSISGAMPASMHRGVAPDERTSSTSSAIEDIAYDKRPDGERRLPRRLGPRTAGARCATIDERAGLEDGARPEATRSIDGDTLSSARRGRRQPGPDARRDPPAGQPRVHAERASSSRRIRERASSSGERSAANATTARIWRVPFSADRPGRRQGRPVRRRGASNQTVGPAATGAAGRSSGIVDASAVFGPGCVPRRRAGAHAVDRDGTR